MRTYASDMCRPALSSGTREILLDDRACAVPISRSLTLDLDKGHA